MRKLAQTTLLLSLAVAWCSGASASTGNPLAESFNHTAPPTGAAAYVPGRVLVKFKPGTDSDARARSLERGGARTIRSLRIPGVRLVSVPKTENVQVAAQKLRADPGVAWAQPDSFVQGAAAPDDALFHEQWALANSGQTVDGVAGHAGADIHATQAWDTTTGSPNVRIAVVDSGINANTPDLSVATNPGETGGGRENNGIDDDHDGFVDDWRGWDFVQDDNDPNDNNGHGTHVSGIVGARGNNQIGVAGVDWNASILPVRVLGNLNTGTCSELSDGLAYAAQQGARVVNLSIRTYTRCQAEEDAIAAAPKTLFVTIAGNESLDTASSPTYPCTFPEPNIICVAATDQNDQLADFSNYGPGVDLAAPGVGIESTYPKFLPRQTYFSDSFENPITSTWATGGSPNTWDRSIQNPRTGVFSLSDSPFANYPNNTYNVAQRYLDLATKQDCAVHAWVRTALGAGDYFLAEDLPDGVNDAAISALTGTNGGYEEQYFDVAPLEGRSNGVFRFSILADATDPGDGVNIDDFDVVCAPPATSYSGAADEYDFDYGTSMAAPYVTGVAALVLSVDPSLSAVQLKDRILATVDPIPDLAGKVATGGRLDAAKAVGPPQSPPAGAGGAPSGVGHASHGKAPSLASNLAAIRRALRGKALRKGSVRATLKAPAAGRFAFKLRAGHSLIATGSGSARRAGRVALTIRVTLQGRRSLRAARRLRATAVLRFTPRSGPSASRSARVTLR
jgi:subtilisin family serine protease